MYDWLSAALDGPATIITANRRLARVLQQEYAARQVTAGLQAWRSPRILAWPDWLDAELRDARQQEDLPTRINHHHSTLLWERCLGKELGSSVPGNIVRMAKDSWQRLSDWNVSIRDVARAAQSDDHRLFAAAAGRYIGLLEREEWIDDAGVVHRVIELIDQGRISVRGRYTFAGFDREKPVVTRLRERLVAAGADVQDASRDVRAVAVSLQSFPSQDAEYRAAGAWARRQLEANPDRRVGIVVNGLERDAPRIAGLVREGLMPGYRISAAVPAEALNVSYGRRLGSYAVVSIGLLWLRWLVRDLRANELSHLLRSPLIASTATDGRARIEMRVRKLPDRNWSPSMVTAAFRGKEEAGDATDWLQRVSTLVKARRELAGHASPADWAVTIDETLKAAGWPGALSLGSADFQLVNRWRDLLNDLARMDLVSARMSLETALNQLESMAAETVFQPESELARVHLMGPLEASGLHFDGLWLTGLTAANWPPAAHPSVLVARRLQERHGMPDAVPADTVAHATQLLEHLCASSPLVVCSYPTTDDDAEQTPSELLGSLNVEPEDSLPDPGWFATKLAHRTALSIVEDPVPPIADVERLSGGAGTIQRQLTDPIAAFVAGRLGARALDEQASGLSALLRGNLIHDALYNLYLGKPSRDEIAAWPDTEQRIGTALDFAFTRHERNADKVLRQLLAMERRRIAALLREFMLVDVARDAFFVGSVEREVMFEEAGVRLKLRVDRIDRLPDDRVAILDYKTGAQKKFLTSKGTPREIQLVAYACAMDEPVAALALVNVDSREIAFSGAGVGYTDPEPWPGQLGDWSTMVRRACEELTAGDVRVNSDQAVADARPLNLLTRFTELRSDG